MRTGGLGQSVAARVSLSVTWLPAPSQTAGPFAIWCAARLQLQNPPCLAHVVPERCPFGLPLVPMMSARHFICSADVQSVDVPSFICGAGEFLPAVAAPGSAHLPRA